MISSKILTLTIIVMVATAGVLAAHPDDRQLHDDYVHHETGWWQGFKNALNDLNPFTSKLGPDWQATQHKVETIYRDTHEDAQRRVAELKEDSLKSEELQQKIAQIYLDAASEAERQIERLKSPLLAKLWRSAPEEEADSFWSSTSDRAGNLYDSARQGVNDAANRAREGVNDAASRAREGVNDAASRAREGFNDASNKAQGMAGRARDSVYDAAHGMKKKLTAHEQASLFEQAQKSIRESYQDALNKAKEGLKATPSATETLKEAKKRAQKTYDDVFHHGHSTTRSTFQSLRDKFGWGLQTTASTAATAAWATWKLFLHLLLGVFWITLGAIGWQGAKWWLEKQAFKKELATPNVHGPVVLSKVFTVFGTVETSNKFAEYWNGAAAGWFSRQPGIRKFSFQRGVGVASNVWCHLSEWNTIEDLRKALASPELTEMKKRMPKGVVTKRGILQVVSTGKALGGGADTDVRTEGLRNRGPGSS